MVGAYCLICTSRKEDKTTFTTYIYIYTCQAKTGTPYSSEDEGCISNMVATLTTKKLSSSSKQTPRVLREMGHALNFINLGKSAFIYIEEGYDTSLYGFPVFRTNGRSVPVRGGQV
ncbi:uncharacterized protein G2W53_030825 [Senna tora]|uniref:Uncharacterized protein n=1 Tax=Senna tora TaxID=362788 RepID=A0A834T9Q5_9FABA|nr:uncharacterized protein G2W53_030825 [Senna tora]